MKLSRRAISVPAVLALSLAVGMAIATAYAAAKPNLVVTSTRLMTPRVAVAGNIKVTYSVSSRTSRVRSTTSALLLSNDRRASHSDRLLASSRVRSIKAGSSKRESFNRKLPSSVKAGSYFLIVCVDRRHVVRESRESDNCRATSRLIIRAAFTRVSITAVTDGAEGFTSVRPLVEGSGATPGSTVEFSLASDCSSPVISTTANAQGAFRAVMPLGVMAAKASATFYARQAAVSGGIPGRCSDPSPSYINVPIAISVTSNTFTPGSTTAPISVGPGAVLTFTFDAAGHNVQFMTSGFTANHSTNALAYPATPGTAEPVNSSYTVILPFDSGVTRYDWQCGIHTSAMRGAAILKA
ncbi:MAG: hypothetical protein H7123_06495 [Thermoleophilia bacterium]|nr:hypothetical protein [Thermoleophilia bacterium]